MILLSAIHAVHAVVCLFLVSHSVGALELSELVFPKGMMCCLHRQALKECHPKLKRTEFPTSTNTICAGMIL